MKLHQIVCIAYFAITFYLKTVEGFILLGTIIYYLNLN